MIKKYALIQRGNFVARPGSSVRHGFKCPNTWRDFDINGQKTGVIQEFTLIFCIKTTDTT